MCISARLCATRDSIVVPVYFRPYYNSIKLCGVKWPKPEPNRGFIVIDLRTVAANKDAKYGLFRVNAAVAAGECELVEEGGEQGSPE